MVETTTKKQIPIVCPGHSRPLAGLDYSPITDDGMFLIRSAAEIVGWNACALLGPCLHLTPLPPRHLIIAIIQSACHDKEPMLRNGETGDWIGTFKGKRDVGGITYTHMW